MFGYAAFCGAMCIMISLMGNLYVWDATAGSQRIVVAEINKTEIDRLMTDRSSPRLIMLMASWCGPCRRELPALIRLYGRYRSRGLKVFGLSDLNIPAIPVLYFIRDGIIVEKIVGARSKAFLDQKLGEFLR